MTPEEEYIQLYQRYIAGKCSPEEERLLMGYKDSFQMQETSSEHLDVEDKILRKTIYDRIRQTNSKGKIGKLGLWSGWPIAAMLIISFGSAFYFINIPEKNNIPKAIVSKTKSAAKIDSSKVVLTLSDGAIISLDEAENGMLTHEGSAKISKTADGEIIYQASGTEIETNLALNQLSIPKGNQYKLTLADGTRVWLNANSTLYYPSAFKGKERLVKLSGEAYFEVAKNENMPFIVQTEDTKVRVLGTHFNVSAYDDDAFEKTTLAEGSIQLISANDTQILKPGQQAIVGASAPYIKLKKVNPKQVLAWKEGYFIFKDEDIKDIMKQISRWYNVKVEYEDDVSDKLFGGIYSKSKKLEELLKGLELTGLVKFKIIENTAREERRVIVMD